MRVLLLALLSAVLVAAWTLRTRLDDGHRLADGRTLPSGSVWLVDDPDACYHLRRAGVALEVGEVPRTDRLLSHPTGSAVPWPALFDGFLAAVGERLAPRAHSGAGSLVGGRSEADLEAGLVRVPPALGVLATLAVFLACLAMGPGGVAGLVAAVLGAWLYASTPVAVWYSSTARVDHHVATALLFAAMLAASAFSLRAEHAADAVLGALGAGLAAGFGLLVWLASAPMVALVALGLFLAALGADTERAASARRAGILFFLAASVVVAIPADSSPWNAIQPNSLVNLSTGVPRALLAGAVPFLVLALGAKLGWSRWLGLFGAVLATGVALAVLPGFLDGAREGFAWASRENRFMAQVEESRPLLAGPGGWLGVASDLGFAGFVAPLCALALLPLARRRLDLFVLVACFAVYVAFSVSQRRFGNSHAVPQALVCALAAGELLRRRGGVRWLGGVLVAVFVVCGVASAWSFGRATPEELTDLADWRAERLAGLQWMRTNTAWSGPWNRADLPHAYGVLSTWGYGHLVEYHARRPSIATNFGSFVGPEPFRDHADTLLEDDPDAFRARLTDLDVAYVVVAPRMVAELASLARIAEWSQPRRAELFVRGPAGKGYAPRALGSALARLALHAREVGELGFAGGELVWRSTRFERPDGIRAQPGAPGAGPVLSIWAFDVPQAAGAPREPGMRAQ